MKPKPKATEPEPVPAEETTSAPAVAARVFSMESLNEVSPSKMSPERLREKQVENAVQALRGRKQSS